MDYFISQENCNSPWQGRSLEIFSVHTVVTIAHCARQNMGHSVMIFSLGVFSI